MLLQIWVLHRGRALVELKVGLHKALRVQLHDRLLRFGNLARAERNDDLVLALAAKRRGDKWGNR